ncbi:MAG: hypothetical protein ABEH80_10310, partial [Halobaculum sp.]|jgi:hypothetical protein
MDDVKSVRGPNAHAAFRLGTIAAGVVGLGFTGVLYWLGVLTMVEAGYTVVLVLPVYLVFAATLLSVWLGFDRDPTDLRPVTREKRS